MLKKMKSSMGCCLLDINKVILAFQHLSMTLYLSMTQFASEFHQDRQGFQVGFCRLFFSDPSRSIRAGDARPLRI